MNEETRLCREFEQASERLRQARKEYHVARHLHSVAIAEVNLIQARLVRVRYGNKSFKERLPRLSAGRTTDQNVVLLRKCRDRMMYLEATARAAETRLAVYDNVKKCVCDVLAAEVNLSRDAVWRAIKKGRGLPDSVIPF